MELDTLVQVLQGEYRALASLHKQQAEHEFTIAGLVGKVTYELQDRKSNPKRAFPENDYGSICTSAPTIFITYLLIFSTLTSILLFITHLL